MTTLMRAKHWHLFLLFFGLPFIAQLIGMPMLFTSVESSVEILSPVFITFMGMSLFFGIVAAVSQWAWQWAMATGLQKRLPDGVHIYLGWFKIAFFIPMVSTVFVLFFVYQFISGFNVPDPDSLRLGQENLGKSMFAMFPIVVLLMLVMFLCTLYVYYICGKMLKSVEMGKEAQFSDCAVEGILVWFAFIGVWFLQPRLNKIFEKEDSGFDGMIDQI